MAFPPVLVATMFTPPARRGASLPLCLTDSRINRGCGFLIEDTPEHVLIFGNVVFLVYFICQPCLSLNVIPFSVAEMEEGIFKMKIQPESH